MRVQHLIAGASEVVARGQRLDLVEQAAAHLVVVGGGDPPVDRGRAGVEAEDDGARRGTSRGRRATHPGGQRVDDRLVVVRVDTGGLVEPAQHRVGVGRHRPGEVPAQRVPGLTHRVERPAVEQRLDVDAGTADDERDPVEAQVRAGQPGVLLQLQLSHRLDDVDHLVPDPAHLLARGLAGTDVHVPVHLAGVGGDDHDRPAQVAFDPSGQLDGQRRFA